MSPQRHAMIQFLRVVLIFQCLQLNDVSYFLLTQNEEKIYRILFDQIEQY